MSLVSKLSYPKYLLFFAALVGPLPLQSASPAHSQVEAESAARKFQLPEGFKVEIWAAEPLLLNPVAFSFDEQGRGWVAETHRLNNSVFDITQNTNWLTRDMSLRTVEDRTAYMSELFATNLSGLTANSEILRLVEDTDGDGKADQAHIAAGHFNEIASGLAAGVLAREGKVWFTSIPDLWLFEDEDGNGRLDKTNRLHSGFGVHIGVTGHDLHGLALGPDGRMYFSIGDRGFAVKAGTNTFSFPDTGGVLRCQPDGSELEVVAIGLRNPQELAFDAYGNLFTGDNDTAGEDNCRLLYIVEGGDYGWRTPYQHLQGFGPWVQEKLWQGQLDGTLPHSGNPAQGPSGLAFYPGTGLPAKYLNNFFICDFPGGIWSFAVEPKGAGFELARKQKFLWNSWPTDVEFGPKAGIYFSDWVGGWGLPEKGRIYRLYVDDPALLKAAEETASLLKVGFKRRETKELAALLEHPDMRVRQAAQFELARRKSQGALLEVALGTGSLISRIHALWGIAQIGNKGTGMSLLPLLKDTEPEIRAQTVKALGELAWDEPEKIASLLHDPSPRVGFFATMALAKVGTPEQVPAILELLSKNNDADPFITHAGVRALKAVASAEALEELAQSSNRAMRRAALLILRQEASPDMSRFLADADNDLKYEAARAIYDLPIRSGFEALATMLNEEAGDERLVTRALYANARLGNEASAQRLALFAASPSGSVKYRIQALEILAAWGERQEIDPVVGFYRPIDPRDKARARAALESEVEGIFKDAPTALLAAAVRAVGNLQVSSASPWLYHVFNDPGATGAGRAAVLKALQKLGTRDWGLAVELALKDSAPELRIAALDLLRETPVSELEPNVIRLAQGDDHIKVRQAALQTITNYSGGRVEMFLKEQEVLWGEGKLPPELALDLAVALAHLAKLAFKVNEADLQPLLFGGDKEAGKNIFHNRADVSCLRCHAVEGKGGTVGPELSGIGKKRSREHLTQSILFPNKEIAPGYEQAIVETKEGQSFAGTVKKETENEIELDSSEDGLVKITKSEVTKRTRGLSAMPEGLGEMLTAHELRDLVEYLAGL